MELKKVRLVTVSREKTNHNTFINKSFKNIDDSDVDHVFEFDYYLNNTKGLAEVYNDALKKARIDDIDCLVLVHDDVEIRETAKSLKEKLEKNFEDFDVVGLAGASQIEIKEPTLWHLMGGGIRSGNLHGCVYHYHLDHGGSKIAFPSDFGPYPHKAVVVDGVFLAISKNAINSGVKFDEQCPSKFHLYDMCYSLDAMRAGLRVGVGDVSIVHCSHGLREYTQDFLEGQKYFINKYSK